MKLSALREITWVAGLTRGMMGPGVKRLQEWLCLHGFSVALDGDYGPATQAQVAKFQIKSGMNVTGLADKDTLDRLTAPLSSAFSFNIACATLRQTIVAVAQCHLAQRPREVGGDNRGPWVRAYCGHDGTEYKWCAGSALSIADQACAILGIAMPIAFTLGCDELAAEARKARRLTSDPSKARGGALSLCYRISGGAKDYYHAFIITAMHPDTLDSIEGNSNDDGSANGYEMIDRVRGLAGKDYILLG